MNNVSAEFLFKNVRILSVRENKYYISKRESCPVELKDRLLTLPEHFTWLEFAGVFPDYTNHYVRNNYKLIIC